MQPLGLIWRTRGRPRAQPFSELSYPADAILHLGGLPGVGKSTLAYRLLGRHPALMPEMILAQLQAVTESASFSDAFEEMFARAGLSAAAGTPTVIETTALGSGAREEVLGLAAEYGRPCHLLLLDASFRACARGRVMRGGRLYDPGMLGCPVSQRC